MQPTPANILDAIGSQISVDPAKLTPDATLESLDLSSLDLVSALFEIEDRFGIELSAEDASGAVTLQDLIDRVLAKATPA